MTEPIPFPVYALSSDPADYDRIKRLKITMPELPKARFVLASKATAERILAWHAVPGHSDPWVCDYALAGPNISDDRLAEAIHWVLSDEPHPKAVTAGDVLARIFGPGVREIPPAELEAEQRLKEYLNGE